MHPKRYIVFFVKNPSFSLWGRYFFIHLSRQLTIYSVSLYYSKTYTDKGGNRKA